MTARRLHIKAPIDRLGEADPLIAAGADELFCGVVLGDAPTSCPRRDQPEETTALSGLDELRQLAVRAHASGVKVHLALNHPRPSRAALEQVRAALPAIAAAGVDGVIVSNLAVLRLVRTLTGLPLIGGSYFAAINPGAVAFLADEGVTSVVLERQIALADLRAIAASRPRVTIEAFALSGACRSQCLHCHRTVVPADPRHWGGIHVCELALAVTPGPGPSGRLTPTAAELVGIAHRLRMPIPSCALCALPTLARYGVGVVKIVGRGHRTGAKVAYVKMLREALDALARGPTAAELQRESRAIFERHLRQPCTRENCYYPHFLAT